jgi:putative chitinase
MPITKEQLQSIMKNCNVDLWIDPLNVAMDRFEINTPTRMAAFLAQVAHESGETSQLSEKLSYSSADRLCTVWPKRFPTPESAAPYVKNPQALASHVYANRGGNGDEPSGDGWRYRGRGLIQLTFKDNYRLAEKALGLPLLDDPDQAATPEIAALTAANYWQQHGLNALADHQPDDDDEADFVEISIRINGGRVGLPQRKQYWELAKTALNVG